MPFSASEFVYKTCTQDIHGILCERKRHLAIPDKTPYWYENIVLTKIMQHT